MSSSFLALPESSWVASNALAFAIPAPVPEGRGHILVVARRLILTWFDATPDERAAIFEVVDLVKQILDDQLHPDGYSISTDAGEAAGQTVMHVHVHVLPRFRGEVRGAPLVTGGASDPFHQHLLPLLSRATEIAIVAAFVKDSGLRQLERHILLALAGGANIRLITGDYLHITQAEALTRMLDWSEGAAALIGSSPGRGTFAARVVEVNLLPAESRSFHPKSWRIEGTDFGVAFVGSSNISRSALGAGIEWNLRADRRRDPGAYESVAAAFERLWNDAHPLDARWIYDYVRRATEVTTRSPEYEADVEPTDPPPAPHPIQLAALAALDKSREKDGRRRALVVLATGLGKTYLAALDVATWARTHGRLPRVLLLAHREELLFQAARTFRRTLCDHTPRFGWFVGSSAVLEADIVFASVQKLSRPEHLDRLVRGSFDYAIVDEVHHGTSPTYRSVIDRLEPGFLLGLTATPERADGADVMGLFDEHVTYRADLGVGIEQGLLVPFAYWGLKDETDYSPIPFLGRRFDPIALERAVDNDQRFEHAFRAWTEHPGTRTLVFCCSIAHAEHTSRLLVGKGVRAAAVHSGPGSVSRGDALDDFAQGKLDALCTVDLFNEGIDLPDVDRVVMLRPTESPVVFLQQLGRGLRVAPGKERMVVIDFVGNHRIFLDRVRALLSFEPAPTPLRNFLDKGARDAVLPPGCTVEFELEAKDILQKLLQRPLPESETERIYRDIKTTRGVRPTASELYRMSYLPSTLRRAGECWFDFVAAEEDLSPGEQRVLDTGRDWFRELELATSRHRRAMIALEAVLEAGALLGGLPVADLAERIRDLMRRSTDMFRAVDVDVGSFDLRSSDQELTAPLLAWSSRGHRWFTLDGARLVCRLPRARGDDTAFVGMTRELVDYWFTRDHVRRAQTKGGASFLAKVSRNEREPILWLRRDIYPHLPFGEVPVRLPNGELWHFRFVKLACNFARPVGSDGANVLPDLLHGWFGRAVGRKGTAFRVRFLLGPDGLWAEPDFSEASEVAAEGQRGLLVAFPTLRAAAGAARTTDISPDASTVRLPTNALGDGLFAVRAAGESMNGGKRPIRGGDWMVMRFAEGASRDELAGRIALFRVPDREHGFGYQVKRLVRKGKRWMLRSENLDHESIEDAADAVPIAVLVEVIRPEAMGPSLGSKLASEEMASAFGLDAPPATGRVDGHLFICIEAPCALVAPDRVRLVIHDRRAFETAFVLTRSPGDSEWRYAGVARYLEEEGLWACPPVDEATYHSLGRG